MQKIEVSIDVEFLRNKLFQFARHSDLGSLNHKDIQATTLEPVAMKVWYLPPPQVTLPDGAITQGPPPPGALKIDDFFHRYATVWLIINPLSPTWDRLEITANNAPGFEGELKALLAEVQHLCIEGKGLARGKGTKKLRRSTQFREDRKKFIEKVQELRPNCSSLDKAILEAYDILYDQLSDDFKDYNKGEPPKRTTVNSWMTSTD